ncbi:LacI family DNA-binding transcriptional regulator [Roseinatronobacter sp. S2]|uniref:LacI family DNA-binding transcriptional regulator n=1 Tax=Roseinatronobacter sp. S2 TaxID=3035471 RepID=UPI00240F200F|nr:LacI family DNA-binding transcriptional regulator [Roseinatronobacter sp. S2]WFE76669.1 LacI family DNA-binding transcriptional regulator [Roseinatronobacter sp. S2]
MRVTIRDVALRSGVSVTTASRALNGEGRMAPETRARVQEAAKALSYRPNSIAQGLVRKRSFTLGLLTNDTYGRFTLPVASGLSSAAVDRGVSVLLASYQDDPELARINLQALEDRQVDGLVLAGKRIDRAPHESLRKSGIPTVHVMSACDEDGIAFVPDDAGGARIATQHLLDLGRRSIAHVTGPAAFAAACIRAESYARTLADNDATPWGDVIFGAWSEQHGFDIARLLFGRNQAACAPDAIFCGNDQIARGMIDGLTHLGVSVPGDVAIVGFDNWEIFAAATRPPLTTIDMGLVELGRQAGLCLLDLIEGREVPPGLTHTPSQLVIRQSCGADKTVIAA